MKLVMGARLFGPGQGVKAFRRRVLYRLSVIGQRHTVGITAPLPSLRFRWQGSRVEWGGVLQFE
ncbi:MAG: hypothetical protein ACXWQ5_16150, partial [Ktedonobacterales bacterium]